ncbi:hypothetical protein GCK32_020003 [Trichostrongylus colubriformis]|uniref:Uncharacterized protein n=1 Tax=Trichostrongylus colubriformis TaxID=6319 RepID=A0AAN8IYJ0_TRICO
MKTRTGQAFADFSTASTPSAKLISNLWTIFQPRSELQLNHFVRTVRGSAFVLSTSRLTRDAHSILLNIRLNYSRFAKENNAACGSS